jgi:phosphoribosylanthranilate isomerase
MREPANMLDIGMLQPDFMGFIFYDKSPRCVPGSFEIPTHLNQSIKKVGVFVNDSFERVFDTISRHELDFAQLHGDETVSFCEKLKQAEIGVIKVFSIDENFDFKLINPYKRVVDYFLFDTKGKHRGGNASIFDWSLLKQYDQEIPFFLSGGITLSNINEALQLKNFNLYGLDVNSGVEIEPGRKDIDKIKELKRIIA